jgi:hypothetical protein
MSVAMSSALASVRRRSISSSATRRDEVLDRALVQVPHLAQQRELGAHLREARGVRGRLDDERDRARVLHVPANLRGRARLVDRHHHRTGVEQGEVDERPLVGGAGEEPDLVAGLDAGGHEALRERDDLPLELGGGDVAPAGALGNREQGEVRRGLHALDEQVGDVGVRVGRDERGDFELDHGNSFGTDRVLMAVGCSVTIPGGRAISG